MTSSLRILPLTCCLILCCGLLTGCKEEKQQTSAPAKAVSADASTTPTSSAVEKVNISDLVSDEKFIDVQEVTSESGLSAWLVEDHNLPLLSVSFAFDGAGAVNDPEEKQGLARMVSNTLDEGAGDMDSEAFRKQLSDYSISLSFSSSRDHFSGKLYTLSENRERAFNLLRLALTAPRFDDDPVERMRAANIARIKSAIADPSWLAARLLNDVAFDGHPYEMNSGGTLSSLPRITRDDLKEFAKTQLTRDRLKIAVVGDIDAQTLATTLDEVFGALPQTAPPSDTAKTVIQHGGETILYKKDIPQTMIRVIQPAISRNHPDYQAFNMMNFILGGHGFGSRLMEDVREERGLTYGIYSSLFLNDYANGLLISTSTANENTSEVLALIKSNLEAMKNEPVTTEEIESAKAYLIGSMPLALTSSSGISSMILSLQLEDLPRDYLDTIDEDIAAVTIEDIQRIASKVLTPDALTTVLVGAPNGSLTPTRIVETLPNVE